MSGYCGNYGYGGCPGSGHFPGWALLWQVPLAVVVIALIVWGVTAFREMAAQEKADAYRRRHAHDQMAGRR